MSIDTLRLDEEAVGLQTLDATVQARSLRAAQLFLLEERPSDSPFIEKIWRTCSEPAESFISVAISHWEIVVTRQRGETYLTLRGPETRASKSPIPDDAEFLGIQFKLGSFMPGLPASQLVDGAVTMPEAADGSFRLNGAAWDFPDYENAEAFVKRLLREGLLVRDPVVEAAVEGREQHLSPRSLQRRFVRATGLTHRTLRQIERARNAVELLDGGATILDVVEQAGFADQAHLTRSLRHFAGQTPGQMGRSSSQ